MARSRTATIKEVNTPKVHTPEIVQEKTKPKIKEWAYNELVLLSKEEFAKVNADVRAWRAKFKPQ